MDHGPCFQVLKGRRARAGYLRGYFSDKNGIFAAVWALQTRWMWEGPRFILYVPLSLVKEWQKQVWSPNNDMTGSGAAVEARKLFVKEIVAPKLKGGLIAGLRPRNLSSPDVPCAYNPIPSAYVQGFGFVWRVPAPSFFEMPLEETGPFLQQGRRHSFGPSHVS